jgi:NTP pyrophosphatase (non-canonical NTP hydrolase)
MGYWATQNQTEMTLSPNDYQTGALQTAIYPNQGQNFIYPTLGLVGEAGEVAEKAKKIIRDGDGVLTDPDREKIALELSDVCWYVAVLAYELDYTLEEIMQMNLDKLASRQSRGVLSGSGDAR